MPPRSRVPGGSARGDGALVALAAVLLLALLPWSNAFRGGPQSFFPPGGTGAGIAATGFARLALLAGALTLLLVRGARRAGLAAGAIALCSMAACVLLLFRETHGLPLYRDDHPSFIFRLWEFGRTFPRFVNYNPYWNGGTVDSVLLTTGVAAVGLPGWPLWRFADPAAVYTPVIAVLFIVVVPVLAALSLRIMGADRTAAACAATLALGSSQMFFQWLLHFGTVGACFASTFVLPVAACAFRAVWLRRREPWLFLLLLLFSLCLASWPPGLIMGAGVALAVAGSAARLTRRTVVFLAGFGAALAAVLAYPASLILAMKDLLALVGRGGEALAGAAGGAALTAAARRGWSNLLAALGGGNPLIVCFGVAGVFVSPLRSVRRWFAPIVLFLALLAGWGELWKPKMQLSRMAIPLLYVAVAPAAIACARLLSTRRAALAPVRALLLALLVLSGWTAARYYGNEGQGTYVTPDADLRRLTAWLAGHTPPGGRILFTGSTVHVYGRGHVAPLPIFTGREMMAFDYYHFPGGEYNYPPRRHRGSMEQTMRFLELYNVTQLVAYQEAWLEILRSRPDLFAESARCGDKVVFTVRREPSLFLAGGGAVRADFNRITVTPADPRGEAVVKYSWAEGLRAEPPAEVFPFTAADGVTLVGVRPNGAATVTVRF